MNNLNIGEIILTLRKGQNITQEQLAVMIGVTAGAVCKWETGKSSPDIALLSPLARALKTSLDNLLSFQQDPTETDIEKMRQEINTFLYKGDYVAGVAKCKKLLTEYPNSITLKIIIAGMLNLFSVLSENS